MTTRIPLLLAALPAVPATIPAQVGRTVDGVLARLSDGKDFEVLYRASNDAGRLVRKVHGQEEIKALGR